MTPAEKTRRSYDRLPYPGIEPSIAEGKGGSLPSQRWIQAVGLPGQGKPARVLVAGCGTGAEAFVLRRRLPKAEIVAVDFSPRSIEVARRIQRAAKIARPVVFDVADLTDPDLAAKVGKDFDLVTCHGVLSYIPDPAQALKSLATCLRPQGALYLGVNGGSHPATRLRPWLDTLGLDVDAMQDERRLRELLGVWDALYDDDLRGLSSMSPSYLASDVCGPHFNNWELARWRSEAARSGWEIAGTWLLPLAIRLTMDGARHRPLFPRGIGELASVLDQARPAGFHRILLRKASAIGDGIRWTGLYTPRFREAAGTASVPVVLDSAVFNLGQDWMLTRRQANALRELVAAGAAPKGWAGRWGTGEAARRILWQWEAFGAVTRDGRDGAAK